MRILTLVVGSLFVAFLLTGLVARPVGVEAGTAVRMDVGELVHGSDLILEGRVLSGTALEVDGLIETEYLVRVERTYRGEDRPYRTLRVPGGLLDDGRGMLLAGMPRITPGEDVLVFLTREARGGVRMPVGLSQGKFSVLERPGGRKALARDTAGVALVHPGTGAILEGEGRDVLDYAQVVAEIEAALAGERRR